MSEHPVLVRPRGTSWAAVVGGWIASVGAAVLIAPAVAAVLSTRPASPDDISLAVPVVVGLMFAYIVGGYVAGRMAGYATSWHGMLTAFFGLFVVLSVLLLGIAADRGVIPGLAVLPGVGRGQTIGDALTFGGILGFLAMIFAGWLGGLFAPDRFLERATAVNPAVEERRVVEERTETVMEPRPATPFRLLPSAGRKGGERATGEDGRER